jgi:hypothetical protein
MKDLGNVVVHLAKDQITITGDDFDSLMADRAELHRLQVKFDSLHVKAPACPKCGNKKLSCPMGHVWKTD